MASFNQARIITTLAGMLHNAVFTVPKESGATITNIYS